MVNHKLLFCFGILLFLAKGSFSQGNINEFHPSLEFGLIRNAKPEVLPNTGEVTPIASVNPRLAISLKKNKGLFYFKYSIGAQTIRTRFNTTFYYQNSAEEIKSLYISNFGNDLTPFIFFQFKVGKSIQASNFRNLEIEIGPELSTLIFNAEFIHSIGALDEYTGERIPLFVMRTLTDWKLHPSLSYKLSLSKRKKPGITYSIIGNYAFSTILESQYFVFGPTNDETIKNAEMRNTFFGISLEYCF